MDGLWTRQTVLLQEDDVFLESSWIFQNVLHQNGALFRILSQLPSHSVGISASCCGYFYICNNMLISTRTHGQLLTYFLRLIGNYATEVGEPFFFIP
jgi:hypothetical protein